jgi:hypothetical protein
LYRFEAQQFAAPQHSKSKRVKKKSHKSIQVKHRGDSSGFGVKFIDLPQIPIDLRKLVKFEIDFFY